jgi:hypothetical protein
MDPNSLVAPESNAAGATGGSGGSHFVDDLAEHQTLLLIAGLVLIHVIVLAWAVTALWKQTPKKHVYKKLD